MTLLNLIISKPGIADPALSLLPRNANSNAKMATLHILKKEGIFTFVDKMAGIPVIPYPWDANMTVSKPFVEK